MKFLTDDVVDASKISVTELRVADIEVDHLARLILDTKTGKQGVRHQYSDRYRERWPQEQYPEKYEEDTI